MMDVLAEPPQDRPILIRVHSHRARRKLQALLGSALDREWFSFYREGEFYWLTTANSAGALAIKGVTKARYSADLQPCMRL